MDKTTYIAIDCGASGGIAIWKKDRLEHVVKMPKDLSDLKRYFEYVKENNENVMVFIEKVQMFGSDSDEENKGKQFMIVKMLANYNQIKALIVYYGFEFVQCFPQSWQSGIGFGAKGLDKTTRKNLYKRYAEKNFPSTDVTLWNADALCILKFGLIKVEEDPAWIAERLENKKRIDLFQ